jgi:hypothetical protein
MLYNESIEFLEYIKTTACSQLMKDVAGIYQVHPISTSG